MHRRKGSDLNLWLWPILPGNKVVLPTTPIEHGVGTKRHEAPGDQTFFAHHLCFDYVGEPEPEAMMHRPHDKTIWNP